MTTLEKLDLAYSLIKKSEEILNKINKDIENDSLNNYYGYTIKILVQELNIISDNSKGYLTQDKSIMDIIESEGDKWEDNSTDDGQDFEDILNTII